MTELNDINDVDDDIDGQEDEEEYVPNFDVSCEPMGRKVRNLFAMKLTRRGDDLAVLGRTLGLTTFGNVCMILSVAVGLGFVVMCLWRIEGFHKYLVPAFLLFPACAGYRMWKRCKPMTFDRRAGVCWPGRHRMDSTGHDKGISIDRIDCLQTLSQYNFDGGESYGCYELNLVLGDPPGERIHVMCHCSLRHHIEASFDLGEFIDKPVWDPDVEL